MENNSEDFRRYVASIVKPIFEKAVSTGNKDKPSIGWGSVRSVGFVYYQPHNCRVYFDYKPSSDKRFLGSVDVLNSSEYQFRGLYRGCRVRIKRRSVEVINLINIDKRYKINITNAESEITEVISAKVRECVDVFKGFLGEFGGVSNGQIRSFYVQENKIESEFFIDSISEGEKFRNEVVKKVYSEKNVEFSSPVYTINYLTNQAALLKVFNVVEWCELNISNLDSVFKLEPVIRLMSYDNREYVTNYLFNKFGVKS